MARRIERGKDGYKVGCSRIEHRRVTVRMVFRMILGTCDVYISMGMDYHKEDMVPSSRESRSDGGIFVRKKTDNWSSHKQLHGPTHNFADKSARNAILGRIYERIAFPGFLELTIASGMHHSNSGTESGSKP